MKIKDILGKAKTPTGETVNPLDFGDWMKHIIGGAFFLTAFALSQKLWRWGDNQVKQVDAGIDPITRQPQTASKPSRVML